MRRVSRSSEILWQNWHHWRSRELSRVADTVALAITNHIKQGAPQATAPKKYNIISPAEEVKLRQN